MTQFNEPEMIIIMTIETYAVNQLRNDMIASVNRDPFFGYDKGYFLCTSIEVNKTDDPKLFEIEYRFDYNAETWIGPHRFYTQKDFLHDIDVLKGSKVYVEIIYEQ